MVEVIWKTVQGIINRCLATAIQFHNMLYRFCIDRGTMTAFLKSKLLQKLMDMRSEVLYEIFLYLHKVYDSLEHNHCLDILVAYCVIPLATCLLQRYCDLLTMVT